MRKPYGFVQFSVLPSLLLIALVVAALVALSKTRQSGVSGADSSLQAMAILVQGVTVQTAIQRALADGAIEAAATGIVDLEATLMATSLLPREIFPQPPLEALSRPSQWVYAQRHFKAMEGQELATDLGSDAPDSVLYLPHLTAVVCAHINHRLFGASKRLDARGRYPVLGALAEDKQTLTGPYGLAGSRKETTLREGCVTYNDTSYTYFKVTGTY